jgi:hypothetical protein
MEIGAVEGALHEAATRATGFSDFGDPGYRAGLRVFLEALRSDQELEGEALLASAEGPVTRALVGRLHAFEGFRGGRPERDVDRPIFIIGMPRTGTTALHLLLSQDPRFQGLESWLVQRPMRRPPREEWEGIPEYQAAVAEAETTRAVLQATHWVAAGDYDECQRLMAQTFVSNTYGSQRCPVPSYDSWFLEQDLKPSFRYVRAVLGLVGGGSEKDWLLKNPSHLINPDALLDVFPDARVVVTHRDPVRAIPSTASLLCQMRAFRDGRVSPGDAGVIGNRELEVWKIAVNRYLDERERRPGSFHDVYQADLQRDPLGVAREIYGRLELELTPLVEEEMGAWSADNAPGRYGEHRYTAEEFGLSDELLREEFARYREQFGFV